MYMKTVHTNFRLTNNAKQIKYEIQCMEENIISKTNQKDNYTIIGQTLKNQKIY